MSKKLLLIDDDTDDTEMFREAIEAIDEKIICYSETNGRKALEKLESKKIENPDVIFLDINMPIMGGWECLSILQSSEAYKNIPVIMYSTSSVYEDKEKAQQMGAVSFITKPIYFKSLKEILEAVVNLLKAGALQVRQPGSPLVTITSYS